MEYWQLAFWQQQAMTRIGDICSKANLRRTTIETVAQLVDEKLPSEVKASFVANPGDWINANWHERRRMNSVRTIYKVT